MSACDPFRIRSPVPSPVTDNPLVSLRFKSPWPVASVTSIELLPASAADTLMAFTEFNASVASSLVVSPLSEATKPCSTLLLSK